MGIIGVLMSLFFRIQLAWPEESFSIFNLFLGDRWAPDGVMDPNIYLALVTIRNHNGVFCVDCWVEWNFSNLFLIPLQIGARDMASGFLNMIAFWLFFISSAIMVASLFVEQVQQLQAGQFTHLSVLYLKLSLDLVRNDSVVSVYGFFYCFLIIRIT